MEGTGDRSRDRLASLPWGHGRVWRCPEMSRRRSSSRSSTPGPQSWLKTRDARAYELLRQADHDVVGGPIRISPKRRFALANAVRVHWRRAVPPGRIGYSPEDPLVLCHSILS